MPFHIVDMVIGRDGRYLAISGTCTPEYAMVGSWPLPQNSRVQPNRIFLAENNRGHPNIYTLIGLGCTTQLSCERSCTSTLNSLSTEPVFRFVTCYDLLVLDPLEADITEGTRE